MYNYFIRMSNRKVHKYPEPMNWMDSDTFVEFLKSVKDKNPRARFKESWRSKNVKRNKKKINKNSK